MLFNNVIVVSAVIVIAPSCLAFMIGPFSDQWSGLDYSDSNFDRVLREAGITEPMRKKYEENVMMRMTSNPTTGLDTLSEMGRSWNDSVTFRSGTTLNRTTMDGRVIQNSFDLFENVLKETQAQPGSRIPMLTIHRLFIGQIYEVLEIQKNHQGDDLISIRKFVPLL